MKNLGFGLGLRAEHHAAILAGEAAAVDWFEVLVENYMERPGGAEFLVDLSRRFPLVLHGVSLSIGGLEKPDEAYIKKLRQLADVTRAAFVSDHLCWTGLGGLQLHDLLPVPHTREALSHLVPRVRFVQDRLGRPLVLENPSRYAEFAANEMPEAEFLAELAARTGCLLLLDVNNVYVTAQNHGLDAAAYLETIPADRIAYLHLAGHEARQGYLLDSHRGAVAAPVWQLYHQLSERIGPRSTLLEWDSDVPELPVMLAELALARRHAGLLSA